jgi:hypothetical protein
MKLKYIKEYANFIHPENKKDVRKILKEEEEGKKITREKMELVLIKVSGLEEIDLKVMSDKSIKDLFDATVKDIKADVKEDEEIDPDLRENY